MNKRDALAFKIAAALGSMSPEDTVVHTIRQCLEPEELCEEHDVKGFLAKYPELRVVLDPFLIQLLGSGVSITMSVHTDPETCHLCWEAQHLSVVVSDPQFGDHPDGAVVATPKHVTDLWLHEMTKVDADTKELMFMVTFTS